VVAASMAARRLVEVFTAADWLEVDSIADN